MPPSPPASAEHCAAMPFAQGDAREWTLTDCGRHLLLDVVGSAPIRIANPAWRATPAGRILSGVDPAGQSFTLRVEQGTCGNAGGSRVVLVVGGRSLTGCLLARGERPYGQ